ncbi:MAG: TIGR03619 family F420-dependent LLM class oxidoreductase [Chloroflexi bacterium]|nr:TIGR03619 family F420-dependent LLM class oxidoreductase [Chloroflexota bacterium]
MAEERALTFGVLPGGSTPAEFLVAAQTAEALGYDSVWVGDHVFWHVFWPEPLTMLAAASAVTERVALGTGVLLAALRRAAPLAKETATLQWLTGGRFRLGVGAGGEFPPEFAASGVPIERRGAYLDATLEALLALWSGEPVTLSNLAIETREARLDLVPEPRIPIWVGGRSEPAQRRAARVGDAWMPFVISAERFAEGWARVRAEAGRAGRDPDAIVPAVQMWGQFDDDLAEALGTIAARIESTYRTPFARFERYTVYGDASMWEARLREYLDAGVRHFNFVFAGGDRLGQLTRVATEVVPRLQGRP